MVASGCFKLEKLNFLEIIGEVEQEQGLFSKLHVILVEN
jgi:hypothetical protein